MKLNRKFYKRFKNHIGQVFMYLVDTCNLRCIHCLYKTELTFQLVRKEMPFSEAVGLMENFAKLGAIKITFMGGEPTLYKRLPELIHEAKKIGYSYVRIDTNGMFGPALFDNEYFRELDEITFSLDGYDEEINDAIRGKGVFRQCIANIKEAVSKGYEVQVTSCVHKGLTEANNSGQLGVIEMIEFVRGLGVKTLNMHDLFKSGIPRDVWTHNIDATVSGYMYAFTEVLAYKQQDGISIRMPQCVTTKEEFNSNPEYYGYCSVKQYDRILAFPNGMLRLCSLMIGSPYCVGYYDSERIYWNETPTNEILGHKMEDDTPCTNQSKGNHFGNYVPLCVSFKPKQTEPVWVKKLQWEKRRKNS